MKLAEVKVGDRLIYDGGYGGIAEAEVLETRVSRYGNTKAQDEAASRLRPRTYYGSGGSTAYTQVRVRSWPLRYDPETGSLVRHDPNNVGGVTTTQPKKLHPWSDLEAFTSAQKYQHEQKERRADRAGRAEAAKKELNQLAAEVKDAYATSQYNGTSLTISVEMAEWIVAELNWSQGVAV